LHTVKVKFDESDLQPLVELIVHTAIERLTVTDRIAVVLFAEL